MKRLCVGFRAWFQAGVIRVNAKKQTSRIERRLLWNGCAFFN